MQPQAAYLSANDVTVRRARSMLADRLRPAEGRLPGRWSEAVSAPGCVDVNETFALVFAWRRQDPAVARDLVLTALSGEQPDGFLPRLFRPDGSVVEDAVPWPLLARATRLAYRADPEAGRPFVRAALPALCRILARSLELFDPGARGQPLWPSEQEAYLPELWVEGLRSVDLSVFLLAEIEAITELGWNSDASSNTPTPAFLDEARLRLAEVLERDHWIVSAESFRDRMTDGKWVTRETVSSLFPLLWPNLRAQFRTALLRHARSRDGLMTPTGIAAWEAWSDDPQPPAVRAIDQVLLLNAFDVEDSETDAARLREAVSRRPAHETDLFENCLLAGCADPSSDKRETPWWEQNWKRTAAGFSALFVIVLSVLLWVTISRTGMPATSIEALAGLARIRYQSGDLDESIRLYRTIMDQSKNVPPTLHAHYANALFRKGEYASAEAHYRKAMRGPEGDNPILLYNLAQSIHRQHRIREAREIFEHLLSEYPDFPHVIRAVRTVLAFLEKNESDMRQGGQGGEPMR